MNPKSRAHRAFSDSENFRFAPNNDSFEGHLDTDETLICTYCEGGVRIIVTSAGLHVEIDDSWTTISYFDIREIQSPETKTETTIKLSYGEVEAFELPIVGGQGKFRDIFPFIHFLTRVMEDIDKGRFSPSKR